MKSNRVIALLLAVTVTITSVLWMTYGKNDHFVTVPDIGYDASKENENIRIVPSKGGLSGLVGFRRIEKRFDDLELLEEVIPKKYEDALEFSEGLAGVRINDRWGFININDQFVIAPQFDLVKSFENGRAEVSIGNKAGVIDRNGNFVIQLKIP